MKGARAASPGPAKKAAILERLASKNVPLLDLAAEFVTLSLLGLTLGVQQCIKDVL